MTGFRRSTACIGLAASLSGPATAAWDFTPFLSLGETYTDNVALDPEGQERDEFITFLSPGFTLFRDQGRVQANVGYQMQNFYYAKTGNFRSSHRLDAFGIAEVAREHFYIDGAARISQQVVDASQAGALDNRSTAGNRTDAFAASVSPFLRQEIGSFAQASARYRYGIVEYDDQEVEQFGNVTNGDATVHSGILGLGKPPEQTGLGWLAAYSRERVKYENADAANTFQQAGARVDVPVTTTVALVALGGYETNDFAQTTTSIDPDGGFWEAGLHWQPNARNSIEARYGERPFGETYYFSWDRLGSRFSTAVSYRENVTTQAQGLLGGGMGGGGQVLNYGILAPPTGAGAASPQISGFSGGGGTEIDPGTGLPIGEGPGGGIDPNTGLPIGGLGLTSNVFVSKQLQASVTYSTAKTTTNINVFQQEREFDETVATEDARSRGGRVLVGWRTGSRTDVFAGAEYARQDFTRNDVPLSSDLIRARFGLQRLIGTTAAGRLEGVRTERTTDDNTGEYVEHAVTLSFTILF